MHICISTEIKLFVSFKVFYDSDLRTIYSQLKVAIHWFNIVAATLEMFMNIIVIIKFMRNSFEVSSVADQWMATLICHPGIEEPLKT